MHPNQIKLVLLGRKEEKIGKEEPSEEARSVAGTQLGALALMGLSFRSATTIISHSNEPPALLWGESIDIYDRGALGMVPIFPTHSAQ